MSIIHSPISTLFLTLPPQNPFAGFLASFKSLVTPQKECAPFLSRLAASGRPTDELVACVIGLAVGSCGNFAQAAAQVVDFYLRDDRASERAALIEACTRPDTDEDAKELVRGYVREGMRLNPQFAGLFRIVVADDVVPQGEGFTPMQVKKGDLLFGSYKNAHLNVRLLSPYCAYGFCSPCAQPDDFPNPESVNPRRPKASYSIQGSGFHGCPGVDFVADTIPEMVRIIFSLPGLRRAPGPAGASESINLDVFGTASPMYINGTGNLSPWPSSLSTLR